MIRIKYLLVHIGVDAIRSEYVSVPTEVSNDHEEEDTQRVSVFRAFDPRQIEAIRGRGDSPRGGGKIPAVAACQVELPPRPIYLVNYVSRSVLRVSSYRPRCGSGFQPREEKSRSSEINRRELSFRLLLGARPASFYTC